jgi:uncharacterized protein YggE
MRRILGILAVVVGLGVVALVLVLAPRGEGSAESAAATSAVDASASLAATLRNASLMQVSGDDEMSGVQVLGEGVVRAAPDAADVALGVEARDPSLAAAQADANQRMAAVQQRLLDMGVRQEDMRTESFHVSPQIDHSREGGSPRVVGYLVAHTISARVRDIGQVGAVVDAAIAAGANRVDGITFVLEDLDALKQQARELAVRNARAKAEQLANAAGVGIGPPVSIEESDLGVTPVRRPAMAVAEQAAAVPIAPGENEVRVVVRITYALR